MLRRICRHPFVPRQPVMIASPCKLFVFFLLILPVVDALPLRYLWCFSDSSYHTHSKSGQGASSMAVLLLCA
jgi:hypothetical protein